MGKMFLWCESSKDHVEIDAHYNLWRLKRPNVVGFNTFFDVGIMMYGFREVDKLNIYLNCQVTKDDISDIGFKFKENNDLVSLVFNDDFIVKSGFGDKFIDVENPNINFAIYSLDVEHDIDLKNEFNGTILGISIPSNIHEGIDKIYFRIRFNSKYSQSLSQEFKPLNSIFESAFNNTEVVDFRLNEKRTLNKSLLEEISKTAKVKFKKIHFFLVRESHYRYVFSHKQLNSSRQLEKIEWNDYVGGSYAYDKLIAYHWKEKNIDNDSFNVFVKFLYEKNNWKTIGLFLLVFLMLGVISGIGGNYATKLLDGWSNGDMNTAGSNISSDTTEGPGSSDTTEESGSSGTTERSGDTGTSDG